MTPARLTPPLKWHGGKHYLAKRIVALMPPHRVYCEPFAGGLSVLLAKDPEGVSEVVNDLDRDLANFWAVLREPAPFADFARQVAATPFAEDAWDSAVTALTEHGAGMGPAAWAWAFFVACRQSLAGRMDAFAPLSRTRTRGGMNEQASAWLGAVEGLPAVHARLRRVAVLNRDALAVIRQQDGPDTLFYCDPPYLHATRATTGEYAHEMTVDQHCDLLEVVGNLKGKLLLSGYRSDIYDVMATAKGWVRHDFAVANHASGARVKARKTECVWANFPPAAGPGAA